MASISELIDEKLNRGGGDFNGLVGVLSVDTNEYRDPEEYLGEYLGKRNRRRASVDHLEAKKVIVYEDDGKDENGRAKTKEIEKYVQPQKFITNYPKRIVRNAVAFLLGKSMKLSFDEENEASLLFEAVFLKQLKMHSVLREFARTVLSETKSAIVFYPVPKIDKGKTITKLKAKVLTAKNEDTFYPHFDEYGDMDAFLHKWVSKSGNKEINHTDIYTADKIYSQIQGEPYSEKPNLFGKIPVVYAEKEEPEWEEVVSALDTLEVRLSRLKATNNYFAEPILKTYGDTALPTQETVGKSIEFSIDYDDTGKAVHGDADYLTWQQSVDSIKLEIEEAKAEIERGASCPDLSASALKGLGNLSGVARRFMMLDAEVKASENMEVFEPAIMRCVSVVKAGIGKITDVKYSSTMEMLDIDVEFESIIPQDINEMIEGLVNANGGKPINSQRTIVSKSPFTMNVDDEMKLIEEEASAANAVINTIY